MDKYREYLIATIKWIEERQETATDVGQRQQMEADLQELHTFAQDNYNEPELLGKPGHWARLNEIARAWGAPTPDRV